VEDEPDESGADTGVLLDSPDDVPFDDVLHALAFLVVVADLEFASLCGWRGEQHSLDGNQGTQESHRELHVSWRTCS
jgi:hypothetical protein